MGRPSVRDIVRACERGEALSPWFRLRLYELMRTGQAKPARLAWGSLSLAAARSALPHAHGDLAADCIRDAEGALQRDDGGGHAAARARAADAFHALVHETDARAAAAGLAAVAAVFEATENEPPLADLRADIGETTLDEDLDPERVDAARWALVAHAGTDAASFVAWWLAAAVARTKGDLSPAPPFVASRSPERPGMAPIDVAKGFDFVGASNAACALRGKARRLAFERVREGLERLVETSPSADAHNFLAFACLQTGDEARAWCELERAIAIDPSYLRMALYDEDFEPLWPRVKPAFAAEQAAAKAAAKAARGAKKAVPKKSAPRKLVLEKPAPKKAVSKKAVSKKAASRR